MYDVLILSLVEGGGCGSRTPVLHCADALTALGARVTTVAAGSDDEIDQVLARLDGPPRTDGLAWPDGDAKTRLVVAAETDGQLRHVIRRMVRRYAPPPSRRPADLAGNRTVPDLPTIGLLPLAALTLPAQLGLPREPAAVAAAVTGSAAIHLDLLRHDGGSVTLDSVLLGAATEQGTPIPWRGHVQVDDVVLSAGTHQIIALNIGNGTGTSQLDGLPLTPSADPRDGQVDVAIAVPVSHRPLLGKPRLRYEVRRARGRAVAVTPLPADAAELPFIDDGVTGTLTRKRSWWIEPSAWSVYTA